MNMFKEIILIVLFSLCFVACGDKTTDETAALSSVQLSDVRDNLNLWNTLNGQSRINNEGNEKIANAILKNLILVRSLKPSTSKLDGEALETLCLLIEDEGQEILEFSTDKELLKLGRDYLNFVEDSVRNEIAIAQKPLKGSGCFISPE